MGIFLVYYSYLKLIYQHENIIIIYFILFRQIRECLKLDPDHKECFPFYKKVKKLVKQIDATQEYQSQQMWEDCVNKANAMLKTEPDMYTYVQRARGYICHCEAKVRTAQSIKAAIHPTYRCKLNNISL